MKIELTKSEKGKLWLSRILGIVACGGLICFIVLYYLKFIDSNMFVLGALGISTFVLSFGASILNVKSSKFWTIFTYVLAMLFGIAFIGFLIYAVQSGVIQI